MKKNTSEQIKSVSRLKKAGNILAKQVKKPDVPAIDLSGVTALDQKNLIKVIVETPKGSRNKYKYDASSGLFEHLFTLKSGLTFPFNYGFIPSTMAEDGDPLDVVILMDEPVLTGCLIRTRVIGILEVEQIKGNTTVRNDRIIAVHPPCETYGEINSFGQLSQARIDAVEEFFKTYLSTRHIKFAPLGWLNATIALEKLAEKIVEG